MRDEENPTIEETAIKDFLHSLLRVLKNPKIRTAIQIVWVGAIVFFIAYYIWKNWNQFVMLDWAIDYRYLVIGVVWALIRRLTGGIRWVFITCFDDPHPAITTVLNQLRIYFISGLAAYIPGSLWYMISRVQLGKDTGVSTMRTSFGVIYEMVLLIWSGMFVGTFSAAILFPQYARYIIVLAVLLGVGYFLLMSSRITNRIVRLAFKLMKRPEPPAEITMRWNVVQFFVLLALWLTGGLSQFYLLKAIQPDLPYNTVLFISSCAALAWTIGFLAPWAPAGLGVRDGILIWFLGSIVANPIAIASAVLVRLATVFEDLFWAGIAVLFHKKELPEQ